MCSNMAEIIDNFTLKRVHRDLIIVITKFLSLISCGYPTVTIFFQTIRWFKSGKSGLYRSISISRNRIFVIKVVIVGAKCFDISSRGMLTAMYQSMTSEQWQDQSNITNIILLSGQSRTTYSGPRTPVQYYYIVTITTLHNNNTFQISFALRLVSSNCEY